MEETRATRPQSRSLAPGPPLLSFYPVKSRCPRRAVRVFSLITAQRDTCKFFETGPNLKSVSDMR